MAIPVYNDLDLLGASKLTGLAAPTLGADAVNKTYADTAAGVSGDVQFNNAGVGAGAANVKIEGGNLRLVNTTDPVAPVSGLILYSKSIAGKSLPKTIGPSGIDTYLQSALHGNSVFQISPSNTTGVNLIGGQVSAAATISHVQTIASANPFQATRRVRASTTGTAGNAAGIRTPYGQWFLGNAAGFGGFFFRAQIGMSINLAGGQKFCGMMSGIAPLGGDPSALINMIGMGYDAADASTGNWFFLRNDGVGVATKVDLGTGAARNINDGYDLIMFARPNSTQIFVRITNLQTGTVVLDTSYTTDTPTVNTGLTFTWQVRNGAVAAGDSIDIAKAYIETDF